MNVITLNGIEKKMTGDQTKEIKDRIKQSFYYQLICSSPRITNIRVIASNITTQKIVQSMTADIKQIYTHPLNKAKTARYSRIEFRAGSKMELIDVNEFQESKLSLVITN